MKGCIKLVVTFFNLLLANPLPIPPVSFQPHVQIPHCQQMEGEIKYYVLNSLEDELRVCASVLQEERGRQQVGHGCRQVNQVQLSLDLL